MEAKVITAQTATTAKSIYLIFTIPLEKQFNPLSILMFNANDAYYVICPSPSLRGAQIPLALNYASLQIKSLFHFRAILTKQNTPQALSLRTLRPRAHKIFSGASYTESDPSAIPLPKMRLFEGKLFPGSWGRASDCRQSICGHKSSPEQPNCRIVRNS